MSVRHREKLGPPLSGNPYTALASALLAPNRRQHPSKNDRQCLCHVAPTAARHHRSWRYYSIDMNHHIYPISLEEPLPAIKKCQSHLDVAGIHAAGLCLPHHSQKITIRNKTSGCSKLRFGDSQARYYSPSDPTRSSPQEYVVHQVCISR